MSDYIFTSLRLGFREWKTSDEQPFAKMNADLDVREFFSSILSFEESIGSIYQIKMHVTEHDFGLYAADELRSDS